MQKTTVTDFKQVVVYSIFLCRGIEIYVLDLFFFFGGGVTAGTYKYQQSPVKEHNVLTNDC